MTDKIKEIGKLLVSISLLTFCGFMFKWGIDAPDSATSLGFVGMAGTIVGAILTYWLKP